MSERVVMVLNEQTQTGDETGAGLMRNRCAFTSRDMSPGWADAFTYAIVCGWGKKATRDLAEQHGWDDDLVAFLRDAHRRFKRLPDVTP